MTYGKLLLLSLLTFFCAGNIIAQKSPASESDLKKQAEKLFEKESYLEATPMYSQLLSLYPRDPVYNYRYGVCLLLSGQDKTGASSYLEAASKDEELDPDVYFYLGRSYMFMDHFNEAINAFTVFKKKGSVAKQTKLQPDVYIQNCQNANELRKDRKNVVILNKNKVNRATFFATYDFTNAAGKLLTTPDRFLTAIDKEKMSNPVMFMTRDGETIYYASYGKKGENGKDIYRVVKLANGMWSEPVNLGAVINTNGNEDYPYLDKDGRTLYFSSTSHNSIGGYDIFKSQYDFNTAQWSEPVNVGIPINTVDDDIFYMPSTTGETAMYSTAVECETGRIELRNIKLGDVVNNLAVISGKYFSQDQVTRRDARITVIRTKDNGVVTSVKTDKQGDYELVLPTGDNYMLVVEGGSYIPHAENFSVPQGFSTTGLKQRVMMNKTGNVEEMTMTNFFTPAATDASATALEKPTQVAKSSFDVQDTASAKMQAITFEGRKLFVAPPSLKNFGGVDIDSTAYLNTQKPAETANSNEASSTEDSSVAIESDEAASSNENISIDKKTEPVVSGKTSNADLVKMAFEDAQSTKEEAATMHESAAGKKAESNSLDSLSKSQVKEANQLLISGDKEQSQQLFSESQQNALDAQQKNKEAESIEAEAKQKDADADKAFADASQMMKDFKVDTNATAYHAGNRKTNAQVKSKQTSSLAVKSSPSAEPGKQSSSSGQSVTSQTNPAQSVSSAPSDQLSNPESQSQPTVTTKSDSEISHAEKAGKLTEESDNLAAQSIEMQHQADKAKDQMSKDLYLKKAGELKKQSDEKKAQAAQETILAGKNTEQNTSIEPVANENQLGLNDNSSSTVENSTTNPREKKTITTSAQAGDNNLSQASQGNNTEVKNEKKNQEPDQDKISQQDVKVYSDLGANKTTDTSKVNIHQQEKENVVASNNNEDLNKQHDSEKNGSDEKKPQPATEKQNDLALNNSTPADLKNGKNITEKKTDNPFENSKAIDGDRTATTEAAITPATNVKIDPVALTHYENYRQQKAISDKTEAASNESEAELITTGKKEKRDSIIAKSTQLNQLSIKQWQDAQKELTLAKQIDPEIEEKAKQIPQNNLIADAGSKSQGLETGNKLNDIKTTTGEPEASNGIKETQADQPTPANEILDTTKPEYPKYVETQKKISEKQTETVNLFVEGMQLNKKAVAIRDEEMKLRDQAQVTTNKKEKDKLIVTADSLAMEAEIVANHSKEKLSTAQKNTGAVKELTTESNELKAALVVPQKSSQEPVVENSVSESQTTLSSSEKNNESGNQKTAVDSGAVKNNTKSVQSNKEIQASVKNDSLKNITHETKPVSSDSSIASTNNFNSSNPINNEIIYTQPDTITRMKSNSDALQATADQKTPTSNTGTQDAQQNNLQKADTVIPPSSSNKNKEDVSTAPAKKDESVPDLNLESAISDEATFSLSKGDANSSSNPIPIDPVLPDGLIFKVQIGAFHNKLSDNTFKNLQPLSGETTRPGWIRYCLGLFRTFEPANLVKKEVRGMGYKDAFVVAYFNGKRIPLYDAYAMISKANADLKKTYAKVSENEFNHLAKFQILKSNFDNKPDDDTKAFYGTTEKVPAELIEYAVQIGVYKSSKTPSALNALLPVNMEEMNSGLYRFTTGRFDNRNAADSMKRIAINAGVKDAFVVIYKGGKKAGQNDVQQILTSAKASAKPVSTSSANNATNPIVPTESKPSSVATGNETVNPGDVIFKIQLGAFKENVPFNTVNSYLAIADKGISQETDSRGLHIFYAGQFKNYNECVSARDEIVAKDVKDAFIVAFVKGRRTPATEALKLLNGK